MKNLELPEPYVDVWVTYYDTYSEIIKIRRGFYCKVLGTFSIPPGYRMFNGVLLPDGFGGDHIPVNSKEVIEWKNIDS